MGTRSTITALVLLASLALTSPGCGSMRIGVPVKPPPALIFESFSAPVETNFDATSRGSKVGTSTAHFIMDPILTGISVTWGDASLRKAVESNAITKVHYVDYKVVSVLGIYVQLTTRVSGD